VDRATGERKHLFTALERLAGRLASKVVLVSEYERRLAAARDEQHRIGRRLAEHVVGDGHVTDRHFRHGAAPSARAGALP